MKQQNKTKLLSILCVDGCECGYPGARLHYEQKGKDVTHADCPKCKARFVVKDDL